MTKKATNRRLQKLLQKLNGIHSYHGFTILDTKRKSKWRRFYEILILISTVVHLVSLIAASTEKYGSKGNLERTMFKIFGFTGPYVCVTELIYWSRKDTILELVDWCHNVENYKPSSRCGFKKPKDWFGKKRERIQFFIELFERGTKFEIAMLFLVWIPLANFILSKKGCLLIDIGFNFVAKESLIFFWSFLIIQFLASLFIFFIVLYSLSFFVLFTSYIIGQIELIVLFVEQLKTSEERELSAGLREVVKLHLDVLRMIQKLSNLHTVNYKAQELLLYLSTTLLLFGKENLNMLAITCPAFSNTIVGLISFVAEKIIDAEEDIRNAYYELPWVEADVKSCKLLLLAMQQPKEIKFGGMFSYDHASLERYADVVRRAYDFGLVILNLAKD